MRNINNILKRNRRIMEEFNPTGKTKVSRKKLLASGFNFNYLTSIYQTKNGSTYNFCYEYGYLLLENEEVLLVKQKEKDQ